MTDPLASLFFHWLWVASVSAIGGYLGAEHRREPFDMAFFVAAFATVGFVIGALVVAA